MRHPPNSVRRHRQDAMSVGVYAARLEANARSIAGSGDLTIATLVLSDWSLGARWAFPF
jgi:hypothetical protein